jgi:mannan endo-1,4-beta-mannosidase
MPDPDAVALADRIRAMSTELATLAASVADLGGATDPTDPPDPPDPPLPVTRGVKASGTDILIDGAKRQFAGWNLFGATGCHQGQPYSNAALDGFFKSIPPRTPTRCWGFQAQGIANLRHVVEAARRNDQLLIVALGDGVSHCNHLEGASGGKGTAKTPTWYRTTYKGAYRGWVDQVTREFSNHEAIAGWEPMNEPIGQAGGDLRKFNDDIGGLCKANSPGTLVFSGQRGIYDFADRLAGYKLAHASPGIDVVSLHTYEYDNQASKRIMSGWWADSVKTARELGKPIILGEVGIGVPGATGATQQVRAQAMQQTIAAYFDAGAAGVCVWNRYLGDSNESYAVDTANDPLIPVVRDSSR